MKSVLIVFAILAAAAGVVWWRTSSGSDPSLPSVAESLSTSPSSFNPYSIEALRQRKFEAGDIAVVREVRETSRFTSSVVSYTSDGLTLYALMNVPKGTPPAGGWPVVIVNHGYIPPDQFSTENSYINTSAYFAQAGFLVLKPDYRGHDNSEGDAEGLLSRIHYATDVLQLVYSIERIPQANPNRIYMYGHSMGGDVTLRVLETSHKVKAASLWAPAVADFPEVVLFFARRNRDNSDRLQRFEKELNENFSPDDYSAVATISNLSSVKVPVIVHHGTRDESVPYDWGTTLDAKLTEARVPHEFHSYPGDNHDISRNWGRALGRDVAWFEKYQ